MREFVGAGSWEFAISEEAFRMERNALEVAPVAV